MDDVNLTAVKLVRVCKQCKIFAHRFCVFAWDDCHFGSLGFIFGFFFIYTFTDHLHCHWTESRRAMGHHGMGSSRHMVPDDLSILVAERVFTLPRVWRHTHALFPDLVQAIHHWICKLDLNFGSMSPPQYHLIVSKMDETIGRTEAYAGVRKAIQIVSIPVCSLNCLYVSLIEVYDYICKWR